MEDDYDWADPEHDDCHWCGTCGDDCQSCAILEQELDDRSGYYDNETGLWLPYEDEK